MMKNKKGEVAKKIVIIIVVLISLIVAVLIAFAIYTSDFEDLPSATCYISNQIKGISIFGGAKCALPGTYEMPRFCKVRQTEINPQDWEECDSAFKKNSGVSPGEAARNCTMQQVLDKILNCWNMGGAGDRHPCSFMCYIGKIKLGGAGIETLNSERELKILHHRDIELDLGCMPNQPSTESVIDSIKCCGDKNQVQCCDRIVDSLSTNYAKLSEYKALASYFSDLAVNNATSNGNSNGYLVACAKKNADTKLASEALLKLETVTDAGVNTIAGALLDAKICPNVISKISQALTNSRKYAVLALQESESVKSLLTRCVREGEIVDAPEGSASSFSTSFERIDYLMNQTKELTSSVPEMESVSQNDLREFAEQQAHHCDKLKEDKDGKEITVERCYSYARELGGIETLEFIGDYKITPNSMFEISFCDGSRLGSGLKFQELCSVRKETKIQIGIQGSGAGGVGRAKSPYCAMTNVLSSVLGDIISLNSFCKGTFHVVEGSPAQ